jgi:hypothetical protein
LPAEHRTAIGFVQFWYAKNRNLVISAVTKNPRPNEAISKPIRKLARNPDGNNLPSAMRGGPDWARQGAAFLMR